MEISHNINYRIENLCKMFESVYSKPDPSFPPLGNMLDPLDELIYIILTNMTEFGVGKVFRQLKDHYSNWHDILTSSKEEFYFFLKPLGLVNQRGNMILTILQEIEKKFGEVSLDIDTLKNSK